MNQEIDTILQETHQSILSNNEKKSEHLIDTLHDTQHQILAEQHDNFAKTFNWFDNSMQEVMKKKDTEVILQAQEKALNLIINSFNNLSQEIRSIKRSNSFDDLKQFQQPPKVKETRRRKPGYPNNNYAGKKDVKRAIMLAA
jgi:hypothetical protein